MNKSLKSLLVSAVFCMPVAMAGDCVKQPEESSSGAYDMRDLMGDMEKHLKVERQYLSATREGIERLSDFWKNRLGEDVDKEGYRDVVRESAKFLIYGGIPMLVLRRWVQSEIEMPIPRGVQSHGSVPELPTEESLNFESGDTLVSALRDLARAYAYAAKQPCDLDSFTPEVAKQTIDKVIKFLHLLETVIPEDFDAAKVYGAGKKG